jgi:HNH endonuclease
VTATCHPPFALTRTARLEMTPVAFLPAYLLCEVAPVHFDADDSFNLNDHPKTWNLPDGAVALLARSADWSSHNLTYGSVPAEMLERFCGDPVQAAEELCRRGLWRRVKGGHQFADWAQFGETADQAAERGVAQGQAAREQDERLLLKRASDARRQALFRDPELKQAIRGRDADRCRYCDIRVRWGKGRAPDTGTYDHVDPDGPNSLENLVVACCSCNGAKRHRTPREAGMKLLDPPQTRNASRNASKRDSHRDTQIDDLDPHLSHPEPVTEPRRQTEPSDARETGPGTPRGLVALVIAKVLEEWGLGISGEDAERAIAAVRARAKKAGTRIRNPKLYIPAAIVNEPDIFGLFRPEEPAPEDVLASFAEVSAEGRHAYDHDPKTGTCRECDMPRSNQSKHLKAS